MDYKYIEQLLERYWEGQTSLQEEAILHMFFEQEEVPVHLRRYKSLFEGLAQQAKIRLDETFETHLPIPEKERPAVKAQPITYMQRLSPLYKAAAIVGITLTLGNAAQSSFRPEEDSDYNGYQNSYENAAAVYAEETENMKLVSERIDEVNGNDSLDIAEETPAP